jgi:alkylation response protein AidB-like acyl-CoA dehydrogenase
LFEWNDTERAIQGAVREFVDREVRPHLDSLEHGDHGTGVSPYDVLRKFYATFGLDAMARESFKKTIERERSGEPRAERGERGPRQDLPEGADSFLMLAIIELCRVSPGLTTAMGVSLGLAAGTIMSRGTTEQKERWAGELLTLEKVGAWAITEPDAGSDAFGGMRTVARPDGEDYLLSGQKTFITNGPYADTLVVYAKLDDGVTAPRDRQILTFVLDSGMPGLTQSPPLRKMGIHASPTGQLFFDEVRITPDRVLGGGSSESADAGKNSARSNFTTERLGVGAMALGIISECLDLSLDYAKNRELWGKRIGDLQLIQLKLADMEVARLNVQNLVFRGIEMQRAGRQPSLAEASAVKYYSSQAACDVAMEAVQLFGGNGYMAEYRVEQLARDAKSLMIYAGSNEVQITHIAKGLLREGVSA